MKKTNTERVLAERHETHGSFNNNAKVSQALKRVLHQSGGWGALSDVQRESIEMICMKLSRVVSGHGDFADHWQDVCGYSELVLREIEGRAG